MITTDQISLGIDKLTYSVDLMDIPLIGKIKIDNLTAGRIDLIINKYYNGDKKYVSLLKDINQISDDTEMKIGMLFVLPDFDYLEKYINVNSDLEDDNIKIPGILTDISNSLNKNQSTTKSSTKTTASPKLKITLEQVSYNSETGKITF